MPKQERLFDDPIPASAYGDRLAAARKASLGRPRDTVVGPDWPKAENISLDLAVAELALFCYEQGGKISCGPSSDGGSIYVSLKSPSGGMDPKIPTQAFTASDTLDKALRKAAQLLENNSSKIWKFDAWAAGREGNPHGDA